MMDARDRDIMARTIVGEAANQPFEGQQAVANVILNRLNSGRFGGSISDVIFAPNQFEPWQTRRGELEAIATNSPEYLRAVQAIDAAGASDPTNGATHFLEPTIVRQRRGGTLPAWAQGPSTQIGNHLFFKPDGGGPTGRTAGTVQISAKEPINSAPYAAPQPQSVPPTNLAGVLAAYEPTSPEVLTPLVNTQQIGPFPSPAGEGEPIDTAIFQPRTTKRPRPKAKIV